VPLFGELDVLAKKAFPSKKGGSRPASDAAGARLLLFENRAQHHNGFFASELRETNIKVNSVGMSYTTTGDRSQACESGLPTRAHEKPADGPLAGSMANCTGSSAPC
jgi:hypothetical protein